MEKIPGTRSTAEGCSYCGGDFKPPFTEYQICEGCRCVRYCSRKHQKIHWPEHKIMCESVQKALALRKPGDGSFDPEDLAIWNINNHKAIANAAADALDLYRSSQRQRPHEIVFQLNLDYDDSLEGNKIFIIRSARAMTAKETVGDAIHGYLAHFKSINKIAVPNVTFLSLVSCGKITRGVPMTFSVSFLEGMIPDLDWEATLKQRLV